MEQRYYQKEIETASPEELKKIQDEKLVAQVKRVYETVPYYRKKCEEKGVTPDDIKGRDDLYKLPFLSKADLREASQGVCPHPVHLRHDRQTRRGVLHPERH